jgi:hypothetical protein
MTASERAHKIDMIGALPRDELKGWWLYVVTRELRPLFDGERAALLTRAISLGMGINELDGRTLKNGRTLPKGDRSSECWRAPDVHSQKSK